MANPYTTRALELVKHGYTPIPMTGKKALLTGWPEIRNVTPGMIAEWEKCGYFNNIGILLGEASSNLVVLDFDGMAGYHLFAAKFPHLVQTYTVASGGGDGRHVYFKVELLPDNIKAKDVRMEETGELIDIEIRSTGLSIVAPPSIHPDTGNAYEVCLKLPVMKLTDIADVTAWVKSFRPPVMEWSPPSIGVMSSSDLNPNLLKAVENYFLSRSHKLKGQWINCACPNSAAHKHGDVDFSFGYNVLGGSGNCFVCEGMNLKEICGYIGIDPAQYGGIFEKSGPANSPSYSVQIATPREKPGQGTILPQTGLPVVKRTERLSTFQNRLYDYETPRQNVPVIFPIKALHGFGGMAHVTQSGKLIGIVGISGGGKTSLLESMIDSSLDYGISSLVWSPEWKPDEFIERAVQRYGGASAESLYLHDIYIYEQQQGKPHLAGKELTQEQLTASSKALAKLRTWETEVGYLDMPFLTIAHLRQSIGDTLATIDFKPRVLVIDYVQLLLALEPNADLTMYNLLMQIKAVCAAFGLVGIIATQVTKLDTKRQADKVLLDGQSARYVNDDAFNLFVTVNPDRDDDGKTLPSSVLNVTKNSMGRIGPMRVGTNWSRLAFDMYPHPDQTIKEAE